MSYSLDNTISRIGAFIFQDEDTSNIETTTYSLLKEMVNRRQRKWAEAYQWPVLYKEYGTKTSTNSGNVTISLPSDFRRIASYPKITYDGATTEEFPEIDPNTQGQYLRSRDNFMYILGSEGAGFNMVVNPATSSGFIASGASIFVPYYSIPSSLASPANTITCSDPDYLVQGVLADWWTSREDNRADAALVEADMILKNLITNETTPSIASADDRVKTVDETKYGMRWGE